MQMMPLAWRIAFDLFLFGVFALSQLYWYRVSYGWAVGRTQGMSRRLRQGLHAILFLALLFGVVFALWLAHDNSSHYHDTSFRWWLNGVMAIYFVGSFVSGVALGGLELAVWIGAKWRARSSVAVKEPVLAAAGAQPEPVRSSDIESAARGAGVHFPARRRFLATATGLVAVSPFAYAAYGLFNERLDFEVTHVKLPMGPAGAALRGRTIAQISDIHISPFLTARDLHRVVDMVNELNADLVFITGDFVTFKGESQYDCVRELQRLRARTGMLGCLGNHEIYTKTEDSITRLCRERDIDILRFEGRRIALGGSYLNIAGVDFLRTGEEQRVQEVRPWMKEGEANLLLSHNPNAFNALDDMPVQAILSGHTHGGQMRVEFIDVDITPARLVSPYIAGMYRRPGQTLYVNRGLGTVGLPIRIGATPEITLYELT